MNATATSRSLPPDIRMTNALAGSVGAVAVLLLVMTLAAWALRLPGFELRSIRIDGDTEHNGCGGSRREVAVHGQHEWNDGENNGQHEADQIGLQAAVARAVVMCFVCRAHHSTPNR